MTQGTLILELMKNKVFGVTGYLGCVAWLCFPLHLKTGEAWGNT
jgi:hypothetical protein